MNDALRNLSNDELLQEVEWKLCREDREYFARRYLKVALPGKGKVALDYRDAQLAFLDAIDEHERIVVLKARQIGYTTAGISYAFHDAFFFDDHPWLNVSTGEGPAKKTLRIAKVMYNGLPNWMKERGPELDTESLTSLAWSNGSRIDSLPSTAATGRGDAVYGVIFDEAAFMAEAELVYGAMEPLCYGPFIVISTAHGMGNWYHQIWLDSQQADSAWKGLFFPWSAVPSRDGDWYRRTKLKYRGQEWMFYQEYPQDPEEAFAKSGRPAIGADLLADQDWQTPKYRYRYEIADSTFTEWDEVDDPDICLYVWALPHVEVDDTNRVTQLPNYVIACDTAEGLAHGDYTAISVWNANTKECVATMKSHVPIDELGDLLARLGYWYHNALIGIERNNHGMVPIVHLTKHDRYPRMYRMPKLGKQIRDEARRLDYGWVTSTKTKPKMVADMIAGLRGHEIDLYDERFRIESQTFVADGRGGYAASSQNHDDLMIATMIGWQLVRDVGMYPPIYFHDGPHITTFGEVMQLTSQAPDERFFLDETLKDVPGARVLQGIEWNKL